MAAVITEFSFHPTLRTSLLKISQRGLSTYTDPQNLAYFNSAVGDEVTSKENETAWKKVRLVPRVLVGVEKLDLTATLPLLGNQTLPIPILNAPTAFHDLTNPEGELRTARCLAKAGSGMTASLWSNRLLEDIAKEFQQHAICSSQPLWLQIFLYKDRGYLKELVERAQRSGFNAIVLTVDAPLGCVGCLNAQPKLFESLKLPNFGMFTTLNASQVLREVASSFVAPEVTWKDVEWLASLSTLPIILKGVLNPKDVVSAAQHGAKGIIVSNHGGRQMDRVISTRDALRLIKEEIRKKNVKVELMVDGGLRDAHDITVALELGAKAVMLGRPILHALGSSSEEDALYKYIQVLSSDLQRKLALMGRRKLPQEEQQVGDQQQRVFFT